MEILFALALIPVVAIVLLVVKANRPLPPPDLSHLPPEFVVFDLETTGLDPHRHEIIEFGAIRVIRDSTQFPVYSSLVKPTNKIPRKITELTGITQAMVDEDGVSIETALDAFIAFIGDRPLVAYNAPFDKGFMDAALSRAGHSQRLPEPSCALKLARRAWRGLPSYKLTALAERFGLDPRDSHRALEDCKRTVAVYIAASVALHERNIH